jgi:uncharacterized protein (TIGR02646 family)
MIGVSKPPDGPASLAAGIAKTRLNCDLYDANPRQYRDGRAKFSFSSSIYGSTSIKNALKVAQHRKCCYCEAVFEANYAGDVDHYRPKGRIGSGDKAIKPGYYWLAYSWQNLYYACADCNQYRKRAAFPLADESKRAVDHHNNLDDEDPLILDPGGVRDPREHIQFNQDVPIGSTAAGQITVNQLKLDREALCTSRRKHFRLLKALLDIVRFVEPDSLKNIRVIQDARLGLLSYVQPDAEFSSTSRDYLRPFQHLLETT